METLLKLWNQTDYAGIAVYMTVALGGLAALFAMVRDALRLAKGNEKGLPSRSDDFYLTH